MGVRQRAAARGYVSLDGVHQGINAGAGGEVGVHGLGNFRIDQGHIWHNGLADDRKFETAVRVGNDRELGNIRRGARRGRNQDQGR